MTLKPLHDMLKKNPPPRTEAHTKNVQFIKTQVTELPCLHITDPKAFKMFETDASDI